jgi:UDP-glucose:glycoprotein glucosyltransferase
MSDPEALSTFKLALSMRSAAPRVEAHYQYYRTAVSPSLSEGQAACDAWLALDGKQYCRGQLETSNGVLAQDTNAKFLPFDRTAGHGSQDLVLYADPSSAGFEEYHELAMGLVKKGTHTYRLRYVTSRKEAAETLPVNGYGVELALKRTDYIVIDDRDAGTETHAAPKEVEGTAQVVLGGDEEVADLKPLSTSELSSLGMKAASFIMSSEDKFDTLLKLTQDFPKYSTSILAHNVTEGFEKEHRQNRQQLVPAGTNVLWMNGVQLIERQIEPYGLVDLLRRERKLIHGMLDLGLTGMEAIFLLGHEEVAQAKVEEDILRFDWRDGQEQGEDGHTIMWLNNLEKDKRYADYSSNLGMVRAFPLKCQTSSMRG